ncbi:MAG: DUF4384 domain-containing protein [Gemmatimonadales bacterium]|nr:DUF4384 domain-containing protein [Gemmatimonadales bacterium]
MRGWWALAVCALVAAPVLGAQERRLEKSYRVPLTGELSLRGAFELARDGALRDAVEEVVGVHVAGVSSRSVEESPRELADYFRQFVVSSAAGRVLRYEVLDSGVVREGGGALGQSYFHVRLVADVLPDVGRADPGFRVELKLDRDVYHADPPPGRGDEMVASYRASAPANVTLFGIADDSVQVLLPNAYETRNRAAANLWYEFPDRIWRDRSVRLRAELPPGRSRRIEVYLAVATKREVPFLGELRRGEASRVPVVTAALADLQRWLAMIPMDERSVAVSSVEVRMRGGGAGR